MRPVSCWPFPLAGIALVAMVSLGACAPAPVWDSYDCRVREAVPGRHWARAAPEALGWSGAGLAAVRDQAGGMGTTALMVVDRGVVVEAWGDIAVRSNLHSGRKSLLSALIGIAVEEGRIDLADSMADLGIDDRPPALSAREKQATVGDLIRARSGIYHAALYETAAMTASKPPRGAHPPGRFWHYNNWDFNALGTIYEQAEGRSIFEAFEARIARPLEMEDYRVGDGSHFRGPQSRHPAYPIRMTARDLARFALLYLRNGRWRDRQIVPADWVSESTREHSRASGAVGYGYMWWTTRGVPRYAGIALGTPAYWASGWHGQLAFVFPERDLVVVHRVNTDHRHTPPRGRQVGRLLRLILDARPAAPAPCDG